MGSKSLKIKHKTPSKRRCSVCRKTGHTKLKCQVSFDVNNTQDVDNIQASERENKSHGKGAFVRVLVSPYVPVSAHVLDTGKRQTDSRLSAILPYRGYDIGRRERHTVDFAALVREANRPKVCKDTRQSSRSVHVGGPLNIMSATRSLASTRQKRRPFLSQKWYRLMSFGRIYDGLESARDIVAEWPFTLRRFAREHFSMRKFSSSALVLVLLAIAPFPAWGYYSRIKNDTNAIILHSTNAFLSLQSSTLAALATNIPQAEHDLNSALKSFSDAELLIDKDYRALIYVASLLPVVGEKVTSRQHLLSAGHHLALGNTYLVKGVDEATSKSEMTFVDRVETMRAHMRSAIPQYEAALHELSYVETSALPLEYQTSFSEFKLLFAAFIDDMQDLVGVMTGLQTMLGSDEFKRYLVLFQNHHELRPTGGFVGSFAIVDVQKGKLINLDVPGGGSYDLQGQLDAYLKPPVPLQLVNYRWEFQDANWFPDFAASAKKLAWFYQHSRGATVDGVIAINASVLTRVLNVLGPVENEKFGLLLSPETALSALQYEVEVDYDKDDNKPKAVIAALLEQLLTGVQAIKPEQMISLLNELHEALGQKELQAYVTDEATQVKLREFGWTGEVSEIQSNQDYLMVVNANVGGGKSDARLLQTIEHEAAAQADGSIIDTVVVKRRHVGEKEDGLYGKPNIDYMRVYVPEGAELLDAGGFTFPEEESFLVPEEWYKDDMDLAAIEKNESVHVGSGTRMTSEFGKTVFGNWVVVYPGREAEVWFRYKLPFKILKSNLSRYSMVIQKQSGTESEFSTQIIYPDNWRPVWRTDESVAVNRNGAKFSAKLTHDNAFGVVMEKK